MDLWLQFPRFKLIIPDCFFVQACMWSAKLVYAVLCLIDIENNRAHTKIEPRKIAHCY